MYCVMLSDASVPVCISIECARGTPHDTRKSDIWSLDITFFEILVRWTPFEYKEGEEFEKKEDLETREVLGTQGTLCACCVG